MQQYTATGNKLSRITEDTFKPLRFSLFAKINKDGKQLYRGDRTSIAMIWNNIIGVNFKDKSHHSDYCTGIHLTGGEYSIEYGSSVLDTCILKVSNSKLIL